MRIAGDESDLGHVSCELRVGGMDCASCAASVEGALRRLDGVQDVRVDVMGGQVRVTYAEGKVGRRDLSGAIRHVGYVVQDPEESTDPRAGDDGPTAASFWTRRGRFVMTAASGVFLMIGVMASWLGAPRAASLAALALSTFAGGWYVVPRGIRAAMNRALDINFLMSLAAMGAWLIGEATEAAATLFLFAIAELLESYSMDRARNAIKALMDLSPQQARVRRRGSEVMVPVAEVAVGEIVIVRPGEKVAVDGEVVLGRSSVNQAAITGESMPVDKAGGDEVFAGSLNEHGMIEVRSSKPASDTTLARIVHAVEEAQASRAPSQRFVDRFARVYTPAVVAVAALLAVLPPLIGLGTWETWIYRALAMLVVACPCALVISTPVSIVSGLAGAARGGVLIKGGAHLENLGRLTTLCIDKTGTLTEGRPTLAAVVPLNGTPEREVLRLAAGVERHSEHPLARAVLAAAEARGISVPASTDFVALLGRGARACVGAEDGSGGAVVHVGNARLLAELEVDAGEHAGAELTRLESEGMTAVTVVAGGRAVGVLGIADRMREDAREALRELHQAGVTRVAMLTGDNERAARAVATAVGADEVHAGLLPDDKVRVVREIEASGEPVMFVGDGINDGPAMAAATVSVAPSAASTDVALETADVALMTDDLRKLAFAVRLAHRTLGIIKQNIALSLAIKAVFLVLAVGGWATLWMAVAADMGGSLVVVANGLRARHTRGELAVRPARGPR